MPDYNLTVDCPNAACVKSGCSATEAQTPRSIYWNNQAYVATEFNLPAGWGYITIDGQRNILCPTCLALVI